VLTLHAFNSLAVCLNYCRCNDGCSDEITALAASVTPSLMRNIVSLPTEFLRSLLMTLLDTTKVCVLRTNSFCHLLC